MLVAARIRGGFWLPALTFLGVLVSRVVGQAPPAPLPPGPASAYDPRPRYVQQDAPEESLDDAWRIALSVDRRLEASQWNLSAAARSLAAAGAERFPSLSLGADYIVLSEQPGFKVPSLPVPVPLPSKVPFFEQDSGGVHAIVTQPIYTFGRISSGIRAAEAGVAANHAEVSRTEMDVKMSVAESYLGVLRVTRLVEVADNKVASLTAHTRDVQAMFDKGVVAKTDLLAAQVALADARQQWLQVRNGLEVARAAYNRILGRPLADPVRLAELRESSEMADVEDLTQEALRGRPEIAAYSAQARALRDQAASIQAKKAPQVALAGGYLYQQDKYIVPNGIAGVGLGVEWNIFDSGRVSNQAAALCEKAEAVIRMRMDLESLIALEVRQKWLDLQTALQRIDVARQATAQADENLRVVRDRYQQQTGTNTEVLDAETLLVQAYTNFYNSTYEAVLARLRLRRAVGDL
jgi:outer membrane protein